MLNRTSLIYAFALVACARDPMMDPDAIADASSSSAEVPPRGDVALTAWLAEGHYQTWVCESAPHDARPPGAHGRNRICSNHQLSASATGEYPVGAASVKELYDSTGMTGYAVGVKVAPGRSASTWYWYEKASGTKYADGEGVALCAGCHDSAPRDYVFTRVE